jgi:hypothetical protein
VAAYAAGGYALVFVAVTIGRWCVTLARRASRYDSIYDYAERTHSELVRQRNDNSHLSQTVTFLSDIVSEATFKIEDVAIRDDEVELILALNGFVTPRSGERLLVMDTRGGQIIGHLQVLTVTATSFRAKLEHANSLWLAHIRRTIDQHTPFRTTATAILTGHQDTERQP